MKKASKTVRVKRLRHKLTGEFAGLYDVDQMLDLLCARNYWCGKFALNHPVDENREVFAVIKALLALPKPR